MQFLLYHAAVRDNKPWPSATLEMVNAALRLKSLPTPALKHLSYSHPPKNGWHLNYFLILRAEKLTSCRFERDFAAKYIEFSFDDSLQKGPDLLNNLFYFLIAWLCNTIAIAGDIKTMLNEN